MQGATTSFVAVAANEEAVMGCGQLGEMSAANVVVVEGFVARAVGGTMREDDTSPFGKPLQLANFQLPLHEIFRPFIRPAVDALGAPDAVQRNSAEIYYHTIGVFIRPVEARDGALGFIVVPRDVVERKLCSEVLRDQIAQLLFLLVPDALCFQFLISPHVGIRQEAIGDVSYTKYTLNLELGGFLKNHLYAVESGVRIAKDEKFHESARRKGLGIGRSLPEPSQESRKFKLFEEVKFFLEKADWSDPHLWVGRLFAAVYGYLFPGFGVPGEPKKPVKVACLLVPV